MPPIDLGEAFSLWIPTGEEAGEVMDQYILASNALSDFLAQRIGFWDYLDAINDQGVDVESYCEDVLTWLD